MKLKAMLIMIALLSLLAVGCNGTTDNDTTEGVITEGETTMATSGEAGSTDATSSDTGTTDEDVITSASIVDTEEEFENAIGSDGPWIIALTKDLTFDGPLTVEGDIPSGDLDADDKPILERKIALYAQDADRNITERYTLTVPSLTINSVNASIQHGTFVGDLYVSGLNFELIDAQVEGNIYFTTEEAKNTFKLDEESSVTGVQEIRN